MRKLIRGLDRLVRFIHGVYEFSAAPDCLLRLSLGRAPHILPLPDGEVKQGVPVVEVHLWNEHMPRIPEEGPDFAWALRIYRMLNQSLQAAAFHIQNDQRLSEGKAIGGVNAMILPGNPTGGESLMKRLGFIVLPYHAPLGAFGEFWENFYSWMLMWTFNPASLPQHPLFRLRRTEIWMSKKEFLRRYRTVS